MQENMTQVRNMENCAGCRSSSVASLKYVGLSLCKGCFIRHFEKRVRKAWKSFGVVRGETVAVGLSGGKDSVAMLYALSKIHPKENIVAITVDGGVEGYDSLLLGNCRKVCSSLGIRHEVFSFKNELDYTVDDLARARPGRCNCGVSRRRILNNKSLFLGADWLAIGHNLDDEVENILLNYINGNISKLVSDSSSRKHPDFVPRLKPLKRCPEAEVALFASLVCPDMDFSLHCPYRSGVVRNDIKLIIDSLEAKHPGIKFKIFEGAGKIRELLGEKNVSEKEMSYCSECGEPSSAEVCQVCLQSKEVMEHLKNQ